MREALEGLWPENAEAWALFHQLATRFIVDVGLAAIAFERVTETWTSEAVATLLERLGVIYDVLSPPRKPD